jgi:hypothetical protein
MYNRRHQSVFEDMQENAKLYQAINSVKYRYGQQFLRRAKAIIKNG